MELKVVGQPVRRIEGPDKVSGKMVYTADVKVPDTLWGKCLRSTLPHARILRVDVARARRVPGVRAVLTGADVPEGRVGVSLQDVPVLARDKVLLLSRQGRRATGENGHELHRRAHGRRSATPFDHAG